MNQQSTDNSSRRTSKPSSFKATFYRQCRDWHAYLSAFAFIALMFFSATGILLNHPEWFAEAQREPDQETITLSPEQLTAAMEGADVSSALLDMIGSQVDLRGAYSDSHIESGSVMIRMQGVKGSSDISVDLTSGKAEVRVQRASVVTMLNELHRGVMSGPIWKAVIDIVAGLVLTLSLIGYLLFFSLRLRLRTSLALTGMSLCLMVSLFIAFVP